MNRHLRDRALRVASVMQAVILHLEHRFFLETRPLLLVLHAGQYDRTVRSWMSSALNPMGEAT